MNALTLILVLLGASVLAVVAFRRLGLPPVLGYLLVGTILGPHVAVLDRDSSWVHSLAEFGVVFLMFSIGLEFSLSKLHSMKREVFGLGLLQVLFSILLGAGIVMATGLSWQLGIAIGGVLAMSSTAVLSKLLAERRELDSPHGREIIGVLLFQDLAVVPLLLVLPSLGKPPEQLAALLGVALLKAVVVLSIILYFGQHLIRKWFYFVARTKSSEVFVLNVLLITLGLAKLTEMAGLSLALGAFVAGMLIAETEYRLQVEEDIKSFRDVLMGLFFVTIGVKLHLPTLIEYWSLVLSVVGGLLVVKALVVGIFSRLLGSSLGTAIRSALWLAAGGEFGFVLLGELQFSGSNKAIEQAVLTALVLSMLFAPFIVQYSERIVMRFVASEWLMKSMQLTRIASQSMGSAKHAILCGFGRNGQYLARFLGEEGVGYVALDLDPDRVREAGAAGENVVFGDATRREALVAAGLSRASVVIVTMNDTQAAEKILQHVHELRPDLPVVVRTPDERDLDRLTKAGAAEVVPESLEASLMLASHALVLVGVPLNRVLRRIRDTRSQRYRFLRGFFYGISDRDDEAAGQPRLHSVFLAAGTKSIGRSLAELNLEATGCEVSAIRRRGIKAVEPAGETRLEEGDVVVVLGRPEEVAAAEDRLMRG